MQELTQALSLTGLILGSIAYGLLVRRRVQLRRSGDVAATTGLQGLVRVMLADGGYVPE